MPHGVKAAAPAVARPAAVAQARLKAPAAAAVLQGALPPSWAPFAPGALARHQGQPQAGWAVGLWGSAVRQAWLGPQAWRREKQVLVVPFQ